MCWGIPISRNKQAFHTFGTEDGAASSEILRTFQLLLASDE